LLLGQGLAGATSFKGETGYGRHHRLKQPTAQFSFDQTPMLITFIDQKEEVKRALTELRKQYRSGYIVTHAVEQW